MLLRVIGVDHCKSSDLASSAFRTDRQVGTKSPEREWRAAPLLLYATNEPTIFQPEDVISVTMSWSFSAPRTPPVCLCRRLLCSSRSRTSLRSGCSSRVWFVPGQRAIQVPPPRFEACGESPSRAALVTISASRETSFCFSISSISRRTLLIIASTRSLPSNPPRTPTGLPTKCRHLLMMPGMRVSAELASEDPLGLSARNQSMAVEKTRSTPSVRWQQISTSHSSRMVLTTRVQTISGGEGGSSAAPFDLRLDIKNPSIGLIRGGLTVRATRFVAEVAASPCGNHLAQVWQVGEGVSPTLDADLLVRTLQLKIKILDFQ